MMEQLRVMRIRQLRVARIFAFAALSLGFAACRNYTQQGRSTLYLPSPREPDLDPDRWMPKPTAGIHRRTDRSPATTIEAGVRATRLVESEAECRWVVEYTAFAALRKRAYAFPAHVTVVSGEYWYALDDGEEMPLEAGCGATVAAGICFSSRAGGEGAVVFLAFDGEVDLGSR